MMISIVLLAQNMDFQLVGPLGLGPQAFRFILGYWVEFGKNKIVGYGAHILFKQVQLEILMVWLSLKCQI